MFKVVYPESLVIHPQPVRSWIVKNIYAKPWKHIIKNMKLLWINALVSKTLIVKLLYVQRACLQFCPAESTDQFWSAQYG
jgi:hypothetical protein